MFAEDGFDLDVFTGFIFLTLVFTLGDRLILDNSLPDPKPWPIICPVFKERCLASFIAFSLLSVKDSFLGLFFSFNLFFVAEESLFSLTPALSLFKLLIILSFRAALLREIIIILSRTLILKKMS